MLFSLNNKILINKRFQKNLLYITNYYYNKSLLKKILIRINKDIVSNKLDLIDF